MINKKALIEKSYEMAAWAFIILFFAALVVNAIFE